MEKPKILSDEKIVIALLSPKHEGKEYFSHNIAIGDCERAVAQAQNDYCYKEMRKQFVEWLKENADTCGEGAPAKCLSLNAIKALQSQLEE